MANKNGSNKGDMMRLAGFLAFVAMCLAIVLLLIAAIIGPGQQISGILNLIKDLALLGALAVPAYYFTKGKPKWVKIVYFIVLACFVVAAIFGNSIIR